MKYSEFTRELSRGLAVCFLASVGIIGNLAQTQGQEFEASYDPLTGAVWFHDVEDIAWVQIKSSTGKLLRGGMGNLNGAAAGVYSTVNDQAPEFMDWGSLLDGMTFDDGFAGYLFPTGLTLSEIETDTEFSFYGVGAQPIDRNVLWTNRSQPANPPNNRQDHFEPRQLKNLPVAKYNPLTGAVSFDDFDRIVGLRFASDSGQLNAGEATTLEGSVSEIFGLRNESPDVIEWTNFAGITSSRSQPKSAGAILPPGLTLEEIISDVSFDVRSGNEPGYDLLGTWELGPPVPAMGSPTITTVPKTNDVPYAIYDSATGGLTLFNFDAELMAGIRLNSSGGILVSGSTDLGGTIICALGCGIDQAFFIEWGNLVGFSFDSAFAGYILPVGLTQEEVASDIQFLYRTLADPIYDRYGAFLITIPEPGSLMLMICGLLAVATQKSRKL